MRYLAAIVTSCVANAKNGAHVNRLDFLKLILGAGASLGFAAMAFGPLGAGLRFTDELEQRARAALKEKNIEMVGVAVVRRPALQRDIVLSGTVDPGIRRDALSIVRGIPGAATVTWLDSRRGPGGSTVSGSGITVRY